MVAGPEMESQLRSYEHIEFPKHPLVDVPKSQWLVDDGKTTIDGFLIDGKIEWLIDWLIHRVVPGCPFLATSYIDDDGIPVVYQSPTTKGHRT